MELVEGQNLLDFVNSTADKKEVLLEWTNMGDIPSNCARAKHSFKKE